MRVVSFFDETGTVSGTPLVFQNAYLGTGSGIGAIEIGGDQGTSPRNFTWNLEVDRKIRQGVTLRISYVKSQTRYVFVVNPYLGAAGQDSVLGLSASGSANHHELAATVRFHPNNRNEWTVSCTQSQARGDLNALSDLFVPFQQPVIRPNCVARLGSDIPNRLVSSGIFQLPWKLTFSPAIDLHTGFPYSNVDISQNYVGQPYSLRLPTFFSFNIRVYRAFRLPFLSVGPLRNRKFRFGFYSMNSTNYTNPLNVYNNVASPLFGQFAGYQHRVDGLIVDVAD
jgi:hypothetical protein